MATIRLRNESILRPSLSISRLFLFGRLHGRDFLVFRRIFQHLGSPENLGVVTQVMFDHAGLIAVTQNDVVIDRFGDLFPIGMQIGLSFRSPSIAVISWARSL